MKITFGDQRGRSLKNGGGLALRRLIVGIFENLNVVPGKNYKTSLTGKICMRRVTQGLSTNTLSVNIAYQTCRSCARLGLRRDRPNGNRIALLRHRHDHEIREKQKSHHAQNRKINPWFVRDLLSFMEDYIFSELDGRHGRIMTRAGR